MVNLKPVNFGKELQQIKESGSFSYTKLAEDYGVHRKTIKRWIEKGTPQIGKHGSKFNEKSIEIIQEQKADYGIDYEYRGDENDNYVIGRIEYTIFKPYGGILVSDKWASTKLYINTPGNIEAVKDDMETLEQNIINFSVDSGKGSYYEDMNENGDYTVEITQRVIEFVTFGDNQRGKKK